MSSSSVETMPRSAETNGYERSRFNALRHGILSRHRVLPWEDRSEYDDLLESLMAEHAPYGPTEHHLVEELAGLMWRKQRLVMAETAAYRAGLHRALGEGARDEDRVLVRALAHLDGGEPTETAAAAIRATAESTEAELQDLTEDQVMTERALTSLQEGKDTRKSWAEMLEDQSEDPEAAYDEDDDGTVDEPYQPDRESLRCFLENDIMPWYRRRRRELENRSLVRAQAFGEALEPDRLDRLARYEVHLDRKLERTLAMLLKLQDLRRTITPDGTA